MTRFIGAEYLIACVLIEKKKIGYSGISLDALSEYGIYVQKMSLAEKLDTVFLTSKSQFCRAIHDFSDYYKAIVDVHNQITGIELDSSKSSDDLEYGFMGYLPQDIFDFLASVVKNM